MGIESYSTNPDNNGVVNTVPYFPTGMLANALDDAARRVMADLATFYASALLKKVQNASTVLDTLATPVERFLGYRDLPVGSPATAAYTFTLADASIAKPNTTGGWTVPANATVAFPVGTVLAAFNNGTASQSITAATGVTFTLGATATTGQRTVAQNGLAIMWQYAVNSWLVYGVGVS